MKWMPLFFHIQSAQLFSYEAFFLVDKFLIQATISLVAFLEKNEARKAKRNE
jgi:hypothetical protein